MTQPEPLGRRIARWYDPVLDERTPKNVLYLLLTFPAGIFWFVVSVTMASMGFGMLVIWVGLFILVGLLYLWWAGASLQRLWARVLAGRSIPAPPRPATAGGFLTRARVLAQHPQTWRNGGYLLMLFPLGIAWFTVVVTVWSVALGFLTAPITVLAIGLPILDLGLMRVDTYPEAVAASAVGFLLVPVAARITNGIAAAHAGIAAALLGPSRTHRLEGAVRTATVQREKSIDAADAERRRIERDLHDGAQQRLVALAMELGRAKEQFDEDPDAARASLDDAHDHAKLALEELRDLARGIHPAVLTDRGLDPALSALAARAHIPVQVEYSIERRLPMNVESAAYYVVSEALANIGKHSLASIAAVTVSERDGRVRIDVLDDGVGGAVANGRGLSGLADRVEALGGRLRVVSPAGGPTLIRAEIPCAS